MCLHTLQQKPKVAEKDIPIFKVLHFSPDKGLYSPIQRFSYVLGQIYTTEMTYGSEGKFANHEEWKWVDGLSFEKKKDLIVIAEGFHAYTDKNFLPKVFFAYIVAKGIVPKGSLYYENHLGLIVSNTIKLIEQDHTFNPQDNDTN